MTDHQQPSETDPDDSGHVCHRCGKMLRTGEGEFWIVRIDAICDLSSPHVDEDSNKSHGEDLESLLAAMSEMSERELMDQVHRRMMVHLCNKCFSIWYDDPLH